MILRIFQFFCLVLLICEPLKARVDDAQEIFSPAEVAELIQLQSKLYEKQQLDSLIITYDGQVQKEEAQKEWNRKRANMPRPSVLLLVPKKGQTEYATRFKSGTSSIREDLASEKVNANLKRSVYSNERKFEVCISYLQQLEDDIIHLKHQAVLLDENKEIELKQTQQEVSHNFQNFKTIAAVLIGVLLLGLLIYMLCKLGKKKQAFIFPDVQYKKRLGGENTGGNKLLINNKNLKRH